MTYWLVKGNPAQNDLDYMLTLTKPDRWRTKKAIPRDMSAGDRVFLYESGSRKRLIAFAIIANPNVGHVGGYNLFTLQYLTERFRDMPRQDELRQIPGLENPSFLKSGNAATIYRLTDPEPSLLYATIVRRNPELSAPWNDLWNSAENPIDTPFEELPSPLEGNPVLRLHLRRERDPRLVRDKKRQVISQTGALACEVCDFNFLYIYENRGKEFCEVHHRKPLSRSRPSATTLKELAIVCSNCHRMLHKEPWTTVEKLRKSIRDIRPTVQYRGLEGSILYSSADNLLHGRILGIRSTFIYDGKDIVTITKNFRESVDEYFLSRKYEEKQ